MIKLICDLCGKELDKRKFTRLNKIRVDKSGPWPDFKEEFSLEICHQCWTAIKAFMDDIMADAKKKEKREVKIKCSECGSKYGHSISYQGERFIKCSKCGHLINSY